MSDKEREYEEGAPGTEAKRKDDPLKEYREKEPMTPAKTLLKQARQGQTKKRLVR
jgi:hypothetical protein